MKFLSSRLPKFNDDTDWRKDPGCLGRSSIHTPSASSDREMLRLMDAADEVPEGEEATARIRPEYHEGSIFRDPIRAHVKTHWLLCECVFLKIHCALQWPVVVLWLISCLASFLFIFCQCFMTFSLWLFMLLDFMLVRCQTCVRLNEASRCREAHGPFDECAVVLLSNARFKSITEVFPLFHPGVCGLLEGRENPAGDQWTDALLSLAHFGVLLKPWLHLCD